MELEIILLVSAGALGGFIGGMVGVGGGLIFAPVLLFYFQSIGVEPGVIAPLTIGSSLACTLVVAISSAHSQFQKKAVDGRIAIFVGATSAVAAVLMAFYVTTKPWYNATVFKFIFAILLLYVAIHMFFDSSSGRRRTPNSEKKPYAMDNERAELDNRIPSAHPSAFLATGTAAGIVASGVGVGGGIVMVPLYNRLFKMSVIRSVGTSSATIVLVSLFGVVSYMISGWGEHLTAYSLGYVDGGRALLLSLPAAFTARVGVTTAHRVNRRILGRSFAVLAFVVAFRLLASVFGMG